MTSEIQAEYKKKEKEISKTGRSDQPGISLESLPSQLGIHLLESLVSHETIYYTTKHKISNCISKTLLDLTPAT